MFNLTKKELKVYWISATLAFLVFSATALFWLLEAGKEKPKLTKKPVSNFTERKVPKDWEKELYELYGSQPASLGTSLDTNDRRIPDGKQTNKNEGSVADQNFTQDFTKQFLNNSIPQILYGTKPTLTSSQINSYVTDLLQKPVLDLAPYISSSEIQIAKQDNVQSIITYLNSLKKIFDDFDATDGNEIDITINAIQNESYDLLTKLDSRIKQYETVITKLKTLSVPNSLKEFHLTVLNYLSKFKFATELMQTAKNDPLKAILALNERIKLNKELKNYLNRSQALIVTKLTSTK